MTYPLPNFNDCTFHTSLGMEKLLFNTLFPERVVAYPCWDWSIIHASKRDSWKSLSTSPVPLPNSPATPRLAMFGAKVWEPQWSMSSALFLHQSLNCCDKDKSHKLQVPLLDGKPPMDSEANQEKLVVLFSMRWSRSLERRIGVAMMLLQLVHDSLAYPKLIGNLLLSQFPDVECHNCICFDGTSLSRHPG